MLLGY